MKIRIVTWVAAAALCLAATAGTAYGQLRVVNYNVAQLNGNQTSLQAVFAALAADDKPGFAVAPHLYVFQEVNGNDVTPLLNLLNAAAPPGVAYTQGTFTINNNGNTSENGSAGAQAMFYRADMLTEDLAAHLDINTGAGRNADRWRLRLVGYDSAAAAFYIYSMHLKASTGSSNEQQRLTGATAIRNNADALPAGAHVIFAGDFNVYHNNEPAYQKFLSTGVAQALDPLGAGSWAGIANAIKHTQAPCRNGCTLVSGGMDDRFDFQLSTAAFQDGAGLSLIPGTYRSLGNDGNHYDTDINAGNNSYYPADIPRSNALANHLKVASDHVPVVADYQIPPVLSATWSAPRGDVPQRVIQGANVTPSVEVNNAALGQPIGVDALDFQVLGGGALSGAGSGAVAGGGPAAIVELSLDTAAVGPAVGTATATSDSQGVQGSPIVLERSYQVLRPSNASLSDEADLNALEMDWQVAADSGSHALIVAVHNFDFDADQATLDIDSVSPLASPFSNGSINPSAGIGATAAELTLHFDSSGLSPGLYEAILQIHVSDEDLPGESPGVVAATLRVTLPNLASADVNCDGVIDLDDLLTFVDVLLGIDEEACHKERSDFDNSSGPDGKDVAGFISAFLGS